MNLSDSELASLLGSRHICPHCNGTGTPTPKRNSSRPPPPPLESELLDEDP